MRTHVYVSTELATELREARKHRRSRQEDLAVDDFLSTGTISRIERGNVSVHREKLAYLGEQLTIPIKADLDEAPADDAIDLSLQLLSIENHLSMISVDEAWDELRKLKPDSELHRLWALYLKGRYWEKKGKPHKAKLFYLQVAENDDVELVEYNLSPSAYHGLGRIAFYEEQMTEALAYAEQGLERFYVDGERPYIQHFLQISKVIYLEQLERDEEALLLVEELWEHHGNIESREVTLSIYEMKAKLLTKLKRYEQAIPIAKRGLEIAQLNEMYDHGSFIWLDLGECYYQTKDYTNAKICFQSVVNMIKKVKTKYLVTHAFLRMGKLYEQKDNPAKAFAMFESAVQTSRKYQDMLRLAISLEHLGDHFFANQQTKKAEQAYKEAATIYRDHNQLPHHRNILMKLARNYYSTDQKQYYRLLDQYYQAYHFEE